MKEDEKLFFKACIKYVNNRAYNIRMIDMINIVSGFIHHKRLWYLVEKWARLGFYNYGVSLSSGWFEPENMPERYKKLLLEAVDEFYAGN